MMMRYGLKGSLLLIGFIILWVPGAWAQAQVEGRSGQELKIRYDPETALMSITASNIPLRMVLEAIAYKTGVVIKLPDEINPTIVQSVESLPLERAIKQILGFSGSFAMIYISRSDQEGRERIALAEVRVLEGGVSVLASSGAHRAVVKAPPVAAPGLSPEERAARRAENKVRRVEKEKAREERKAKRGGGNRGNLGSFGQSTSKLEGDPAAQTPQAPGAKSGSQAPQTRKNR